MNIVLLDNALPNPTGRDWPGLSELGKCTINYFTAPDQIIDYAKNAHVLLTGGSKITSDVMHACPNLRYIGATSTGYDYIDVAAARKKGIVVTNIPDYCTDTVAEYVFSQILSFNEKMHVFNKESMSKLVRNNDFSLGKEIFTRMPPPSLSDKIMGIVGMGKVGTAVKDIANAYKMKVIYYSRTKKNFSPNCAEFCQLDDVFRRADYLSLHCPLDNVTHGMVTSDRLNMMKPNAVFINTSRGPIVDEEALLQVLLRKRIRGAILDVFNVEPVEDNPLSNLNNCLMSPHVAWASKIAQDRLLQRVVDNIKAFMNGTPENVVGSNNNKRKPKAGNGRDITAEIGSGPKTATVSAAGLTTSAVHAPGPGSGVAL